MRKGQGGSEYNMQLPVPCACGERKKERKHILALRYDHNCPFPSMEHPICGRKHQSARYLWGRKVGRWDRASGVWNGENKVGGRSRRSGKGVVEQTKVKEKKKSRCMMTPSKTVITTFLSIQTRDIGARVSSTVCLFSGPPPFCEIQDHQRCGALRRACVFGNRTVDVSVSVHFNLLFLLWDFFSFFRCPT